MSVDVRIPTFPITITTSALTELAWILGGFVVSDAEDEATVIDAAVAADSAAASASSSASASAAAAAVAAAAAARPGSRGSSSSGSGIGGVGGRVTGRGSSGGGSVGVGSSDGRHVRRGSKLAGPSSPSPLMPVKVIYRRPSKVSKKISIREVEQSPPSFPSYGRLPIVSCIPYLRVTCARSPHFVMFIFFFQRFSCLGAGDGLWLLYYLPSCLNMPA